MHKLGSIWSNILLHLLHFYWGTCSLGFLCWIIEAHKIGSLIWLKFDLRHMNNHSWLECSCLISMWHLFNFLKAKRIIFLRYFTIKCICVSASKVTVFAPPPPPPVPPPGEIAFSLTSCKIWEESRGRNVKLYGFFAKERACTHAKRHLVTETPTTLNFPKAFNRWQQHHQQQQSM